MKTPSILLEKKGENLFLTYNVKKVRYNEIITASICITILLTLYFSTYGINFPKDSGDIELVVVMCLIFSAIFIYHLLLIFLHWRIQLIKSRCGFIVVKNNVVKTDVIKSVIKNHVIGKNDHGYLIAVRDANNKIYTLFEELPDLDADDVTLFLSTEMNVSIELIGPNF